MTTQSPVRISVTGQGGDSLGHIENLRWIPDQATAEKLYVRKTAQRLVLITVTLITDYLRNQGSVAAIDLSLLCSGHAERRRVSGEPRATSA